MHCFGQITKKLGFVLAVILLMNGAVVAQDKEGSKINIGDKAPVLKYGKWLKGTPVKQYEPGRLYIVEFWATWCGPCIASMPHLSEFAKKHQKEATVIGVNIWEGSHGDDNKPYDSYLPKVDKFVKGMGNKMAYNVMMDNNDQFMGNSWMKAAGQDGIPCSFIIKNGTILWIGHPIELDSIITVVTSSSYDVAAARKAADKKSAENEAMEGQWKAVMAAYTEAVKVKDFNKALQVLDSAAEKMPVMAGTFGFFKFQVLIENYSEDTAMTFVKKWQSGKPGYTGSVGSLICNRKGLSKETYQYGIKLLADMADGPNAIPALMYNEIAKGYANMGDYKRAAETQEKAITLARQSLKEGKHAGFIMEETVKTYQTSLDEFKKHLN